MPGLDAKGTPVIAPVASAILACAGGLRMIWNARGWLEGQGGTPLPSRPLPARKAPRIPDRAVVEDHDIEFLQLVRDEHREVVADHRLVGSGPGPERPESLGMRQPLCAGIRVSQRFPFFSGVAVFS